ncbi:MAG TPA: hypothetical protein VF897_18965, partial [Roseiflexaceae bacterium]
MSCLPTRRLCALVLLIILLTACPSVPAAPVAPSATSVRAPQPALAPTEPPPTTSTPRPTDPPPTAAPTATPAATPTAEPTATPAPVGPGGLPFPLKTGALQFGVAAHLFYTNRSLPL